MNTKHIFVESKYCVLGKKINVAQVGRGETLVMIHGWSSSWVSWALLAEALSPYYRVVMIDMPGFGDSDELEHYSIEIEAQYVAETIRVMGIQPAALIGGSLGVYVAVCVAAHYPELCENVILLSAVFGKTPIQPIKDLFHIILKLAAKTQTTQKLLGKTAKSWHTAYLIERYLNAYRFDKERFEKYNMVGRQKMNEMCYVALGLSAYDFDLQQYLREVEKQTLIIYGEEEKLVMFDGVREALERLNRNNIVLRIVKEAAHNPGYEQPSVTAGLIQTFLQHGHAHG